MGTKKKKTVRSKKADPRGSRVIYTAWITLRNGRRLYAAQYGLKAFAIRIRTDPA